jgi:hypothetical protein
LRHRQQKLATKHGAYIIGEFIAALCAEHGLRGPLQPLQLLAVGTMIKLHILPS